MVNMWMVRAGENAFLINDFKELNLVAIGWEVGDLSDKNPNEIKQIMRKKYHDINNLSLGQNSSQVIIVYYLKFINNREHSIYYVY